MSASPNKTCLVWGAFLARGAKRRVRKRGEFQKRGIYGMISCMEWIYTILFFAGIWFIGWVISKIVEAVNRRREKVRNEVADEILKDINIDETIEGYQSKLAEIGYTRRDYILDYYRYAGSKHTKSADDLLGKCPSCKSGYLTLRVGKYGKFIGCSGYPACIYKKNLKVAKKEFKQSVNEQIASDIQSAYQ